MAKKRFKESEIQNILQDYRSGTPIHILTQKYEISLATFYNWKAKYNNRLLFDLQDFNKLKEDNERLKRMFADLSLENLSLKAQLKKLEKY
jgi:putative transposase